MCARHQCPNHLETLDSMRGQDVYRDSLGSDFKLLVTVSALVSAEPAIATAVSPLAAQSKSLHAHRILAPSWV